MSTAQPASAPTPTPSPAPRPKGRFKWEPFAAILALIAVSLYIVYEPGQPKGEPVRIANSRGVITSETDQDSKQVVYRLILRDGFKSPPMSARDVEQTFGPRVMEALTAVKPNWLFRLCNVTTWTSFIWVAVGLAGQAAFSGRMLIQWLSSEKRRQSVIPASFWWLSLFGATTLFAYFVWRQDVVAVLGQAPGLVIYARNLRLISKQNRREAEAATASANITIAP